MKYKKVLIPILIILGGLFLLWLTFGINPTKENVDEFFEDYYCSADFGDYDEEHVCAYYLRRQSTVLFGKVYNIYEGPLIVIPSFLLYVNTPFYYFHYVNPNTSEEHVYVSVLTRDGGALVYDLVNGKYVKKFEEFSNEEIHLAYNPTTKEYINNF